MGVGQPTARVGRPTVGVGQPPSMNKRGGAPHQYGGQPTAVYTVAMGTGVQNERGVMGAGGVGGTCAERAWVRVQVHGMKGGAGDKHPEWAQVQVCGTGMGASMVQAWGMGGGAGMWNSRKWQLSGSPQTVQNSPELSPKTFFFGGTGIRGPTQKWGSGAPHKFFGSACGGRGSPLERSVGSPTSSFCKMWAAPPQMWAAPPGVGLPMKLDTARVI
ncbi:hypothetical protein B0H14DRAFT_2627565 [Mycena olivaceomarginata]|nr:hypothetical protein B0H14DRAFT_2627565 [Mycena olivaceomarginata]